MFFFVCKLVQLLKNQLLNINALQLCFLAFFAFENFFFFSFQSKQIISIMIT